MATIKITIPPQPDANPVISVAGFAGPGCQDLTRNIESALGKVVTDVETDDAYQTPQVEQDQQRLHE